jgi:DNA-binding response OmpR family regulator
MVQDKLILIADDDDQIRELLKMYFVKEKFAVETAADGAQTIAKVQQLSPSLVILDIMMPVIDGLEACRQIREFSRVPIIMLTACAEDDERILGLETGADDYVAKPFNPREVVARVNAVLRRAPIVATKNANKLSFPQLEIDISQYTVIAWGKSVSMTAKELELLWHLATHPGRVFSREQLLESVWGYTYCGDTRTVDTHIKRIRQKIEAQDKAPWDVKTVWGVGYKFEVMA